MKKILSLIVSVCLCSAAFGNVTVINQLIDANSSWTVPQGKVLILNQVIRADFTSLGNGFIIKVIPNGAVSNEGFALQVWGTVNQAGTQMSLPFVAGTKFENGAGLPRVMLMGKLADEADLFACVPVEELVMDIITNLEV